MTSEHAQTAAMFTILESCWVIFKEMDTREFDTTGFILFTQIRETKNLLCFPFSIKLLQDWE